MSFQQQMQAVKVRLETLGDTASESQVDNLEGWIVQNVARDYWEDILNMLHQYGKSYDSLYTNISMRIGEWGG